MMSTLGNESVAERWHQAKAMMMFKIFNNLIDIPLSLSLQLHIIITVQKILFLFRLGELKILRTQFDIDLEQRKDLARPWRIF